MSNEHVISLDAGIINDCKSFKFFSLYYIFIKRYGYIALIDAKMVHYIYS